MKDALGNNIVVGGYLITYAGCFGTFGGTVVIGQINAIHNNSVQLIDVMPAPDGTAMSVPLFKVEKSLFVRKGIGYEEFSGFTLEHKVP